MNLKTLLIVITIIVSPLLSYGQLFVDITGKVVNSNTGEPLQGANVLIEQTSLGGATDENGLFSIRNLPVGNYTISASVIGYEIQKKLIYTESKNITINFSLTSKILEGENIIVSASRAITGKTPIAFSNIDSRTLSEKYSSQELPLLLDEVPSLYSYSFTGNGMGYSEIKIRGFDATRIAVTINNVPLNDPEDHLTYFYDIADLSANIQDIQVQRGVGNSLYGTAAIGGSVNILTKGAGTEPGITLSATSGSYNTRRLNFSYGTGYIENKYSAYGRFSKLQTDGYRNDSGVDSWSYFLSASRYDRDMTTTFNIFGGPLKAKFAWVGVAQELLDDENDRRTNFYSPSEFNSFFDDQKDDFLQSHYQLLNDWKVSKNIRLENTFFHVKGDGFFQDYVSGADPSEFNLSDTDLNDVVRRNVVDKSQWGWLPRLTLHEESWSLTMGGELSLFNSDHWGEVVWANNNSATPPNNRYYGYKSDKLSATVYVHGVMDIDDLTSLMLDIQYQHIGSSFVQEKVGAFTNGYEYELNYNFISPRIGINRKISEELSAFANLSIAKREPRDADIYDSDDPSAEPLFELNSNGTLNFQKPLIDEETLYDYEIGSSWRNSVSSIKLNLYWMDFRNEIVPTGQLDDIGQPIYFNADQSIHRGIEIDGSHSFYDNLYLSGNFSLNDNYFVTYNEVGYDGIGNKIPLDRSTNKIAGFPNYLGGIKLGYRNEINGLFIHTRFVGKQYLDNSQTESLSIKSYKVVNLYIGHDFSHGEKPLPLSIQVHVNNLLNTKYETHGSVYSDTAFFIPAALRNASITMVVKF